MLAGLLGRTKYISCYPRCPSGLFDLIIAYIQLLALRTMAQSCPRLTSTTSCSGLHIITAILNQSRLEQTTLSNGTGLGYHRDRFLNFFSILERNLQASDTGRALGLSVYTLVLRTYEICTTRVLARVCNKQLQIAMVSSSLLASFRAWVEETSLRELVEVSWLGEVVEE